MSTHYKVIHWNDEWSGCLEIRAAASGDGFPTIAEAAQDLANAGDYIVAVDDGTGRSLTKEEEQELASLRRIAS